MWVGGGGGLVGEWVYLRGLGVVLCWNGWVGVDPNDPNSYCEHC